MPLFDEEAAVSVVGTRTCTPYGISAAEELGYQLAKEGAVVVSGLARGIDGASHRGALRAGGFTAAVLGALVLGEPVSLSTLLGIIFVLGGIVVVNLPGHGAPKIQKCGKEA